MNREILFRGKRVDSSEWFEGSYWLSRSAVRETTYITDGTYNACSKLYGACIRIARNMGYKKIITYTLASEPGASLRASNFEYDGVAGGKMWTGDRKRDNGVPQEMKQRWVYKIMGGEKNE